MPHFRKRLLLPLLLKRIKFWPVVGVVGARQSGKSFLLNQLLSNEVSCRYSTMDSKVSRKRAESAPDSFTERADKKLLIIDEVQKVPDLFDSVKLHVDSKRIPGSYLLSGSTEFSREIGIRESLTGRIAVLHLFPLVTSEIETKTYWGFVINQSTKHRLTLAQFDQRIERGGMPGLCFIRNRATCAESSDLWFETTCYRDLQRVKGRTLSGDLAMQILTHVAQLEEPTASNIAQKTHVDSRTATRYLSALESIQVLQRLSPHPGGIGKNQYLLCDSGLAYHLGANRENQLRTFVIHETLAKIHYEGLPRPIVQFFRAPKRHAIPLVVTWPRTRTAPQDFAISIVDSESPSKSDFEKLKLIRKMHPTMRTILLTQTSDSYIQDGCEVHSLRG